MLTPRESQIVAGLVRGDRNKDIARDLGISPATVKNHVENVLHKLGVERRGQVAGALEGRGA